MAIIRHSALFALLALFAASTNANKYNNGFGRMFTCNGCNAEGKAKAGCENHAGSGKCTKGSCGDFTYYYITSQKSCDCNKPVGSTEWVYAVAGGHTNVCGPTYGGSCTPNTVATGSLFVRERVKAGCVSGSWAMKFPNFGISLETTTVSTTTTTATATTATTTTTYAPQRCHGVSEPVSCGTRIPTGDCTVGGEHQEFAEKQCPAMCGLKCSSTTTTVSSTTTSTTTTSTATSSTATSSSTTATTITTFTTTTVLTLNSKCNPRDDRCDRQEGLSCDVEHYECRHHESITIPPFLQAEVARLVEAAVSAADASKDREIATLNAATTANMATLTAKLTHEKEIAVIFLKANLTVCKSQLEAKRLARLAEASNSYSTVTSAVNSPNSDEPDVDTSAGIATSEVSSTAAAAGGGNGPIGLAVGIGIAVVVIATLINVVIRCRGQHADGGGSNTVPAFVNPMYHERNNDVAAGVSPTHSPSNEQHTVASFANDEDTYEDVDNTFGEQTYEEIAGHVPYTSAYMTVTEPGGVESSYGPALDQAYEDVGDDADLNC